MKSKIIRIGPTSANRVYLVRASPSPKFLVSLGTSDILETLGDILLGGVNKDLNRSLS